MIRVILQPKMNITINEIMPDPLRETDNSGSEVWLREGLVFKGGRSYLVSAPSGKGKTTLLAILFGIRKDFSGMFFLDDTPASGIGLNEWTGIRRNRLSYVFQGLRLFPKLTAEENIKIKNNLTGFKSDEEINRMAGMLGLQALMKKEAQYLSFGQQQRIAVIRALCQPFEFLFLDEPFSHLDKDNINTTFGLIKEECSRQGAGCILTSLGNDYGSEFDEVLRL